MGMFDSVNVVCPKCDCSIEFQSKAGDCNLTDYNSRYTPVAIAIDISGNIEICPSCDTRVQLVYDRGPKFVRMGVLCV